MSWEDDLQPIRDPLHKARVAVLKMYNSEGADREMVAQAYAAFVAIDDAFSALLSRMAAPHGVRLTNASRVNGLAKDILRARLRAARANQADDKAEYNLQQTHLAALAYDLVATLASYAGVFAEDVRRMEQAVADEVEDIQAGRKENMK